MGKKAWEDVVFGWIQRSKHAAAIRTAGYPAPLSRFLREIDIYIEHATGGSVRHAAAIVAYFYHATADGRGVDERITAYIRESETRYRARNRRDHLDALRLKEARAGRPTGASHLRTPGQREELIQSIARLLLEGKSLSQVMLSLSIETGNNNGAKEHIIDRASRSIRKELTELLESIPNVRPGSNASNSLERKFLEALLPADPPVTTPRRRPARSRGQDESGSN